MQNLVSNKIAIRGTKSDVINFMNDGLQKFYTPIEDISEDVINEIESPVSLCSWLSEVKNDEDDMWEILGCKRDAEFDYWECVMEDDEYSAVCGYCDTQNDAPIKWLTTMFQQYPSLDFTIWSTDENNEICGYFDARENKWIENIVEKFQEEDKSPQDYWEDFVEETEAAEERFQSFIESTSRG